MLREVSDNMAFNRDDMTCTPHMADSSEYANPRDDDPAEDQDSCLESLLSLSESIAEVVASPQADQLPKRVLEMKVSALFGVHKRARSYREMHIRDDIVDVIMEKKRKMILDATTVQELKRICAEPKPYYTGNQFKASKYCIPEEELIAWSCTSLRAPLNAAGFNRYMQLFKEVFGFLPWEDQ